jgi:hypothetical protein
MVPCLKVSSLGSNFSAMDDLSKKSEPDEGALKSLGVFRMMDVDEVNRVPFGPIE